MRREKSFNPEFCSDEAFTAWPKIKTVVVAYGTGSSLGYLEKWYKFVDSRKDRLITNCAR